MRNEHAITLKLVGGCVVIVCKFYINIMLQKYPKNTYYHDGQYLIQKEVWERLFHDQCEPHNEENDTRQKLVIL